MKTLILAAMLCAFALPYWPNLLPDMIVCLFWQIIALSSLLDQSGIPSERQPIAVKLARTLFSMAVPHTWVLEWRKGLTRFVLSHGSGGNMDALGWLSSELALNGAVVLAVNHPGSTSGDSSPRCFIKLWERAADISAALDHLLADPTFAAHIDTSRISAVGFSMGGGTVLNLGGARMCRADLVDYCDHYGAATVECVFFAKGAVDIGTNGSNLSGRLPNAEYIEIAPASHFTFWAECTDIAPQILAEEGEDAICDDPEGTDRATVHNQIMAEISRFLEL